MNEKFGITAEFARQMESLYNRVRKGGTKNIERLTILIEKYPHVPQLKHYLSIAYMNTGNIEKAREVLVEAERDIKNAFLKKKVIAES
jgi:hypothetical protein